MLAVEANDKIDAALAEFTGPCAGVWSLSSVLASEARRLQLNGDLLAAATADAGLRIVFIASGRPQLTRLVPGVVGGQAIANELVRTLRHLENTRVLERDGKAIAVWLLGEVDQAESAINKDRLSLLRHDRQWRDLVLDRVSRYPAGQLAAVLQRVDFLSALWTRRIRMGVGIAAAIAAALLSWQFVQWNSERMQVNQLAAQIASLGQESAALEDRIASLGVSPQLVRAALQVDQRELQQVPSFFLTLAALSKAVTQAPDLRLFSLEWTIMEPGQQACVQLGGPAPAAVENVGDQAAPDSMQGHVGELRFKTVPPASWTLQQQEREWALLSQRISSTDTMKVQIDPATTARSQSVSLDGAKGASTDVPKEWCLVVSTSQLPVEEKKP